MESLKRYLILQHRRLSLNIMSLIEFIICLICFQINQCFELFGTVLLPDTSVAERQLGHHSWPLVVAKVILDTHDRFLNFTFRRYRRHVG